MEKKENKKGLFKNLFNFKESKVVKAVKTTTNQWNNFVRSYQLGQFSASQYNWNPDLSSEIAYLRSNFRTMIARSRDLHRNSPIAKKYIQLNINSILGKNGFTFQSDCYDYVNSKIVSDDVANSIVEDHYYKWSEKGNCEVTGTYNMSEVVEVMIKSLCTDGEILYLNVREKPNPNNPYGYQIQVLDPQRIDCTYDDTLKNGNVIRQGIELDKFGRVIAYHLREFNNATSDQFIGTYTNSKRIRMLKGDAELVFEKIFPEQIRGVPKFHAVGQYIKELEDYNKATMQAAKMGAKMNVYLEKSTAVNNGDFANQDGEGNYHLTMDNTEILSMPEGFSVKGFQGQYPSDVYHAYTKKMIQMISAGLNVSPLFLGNDTEDVNYSTSRTILSEERESWKKVQRFYIDNIMTPIFLEWLKQSLLKGKLTLAKGGSLPIEKFDKFKNHRFYGRTWAGIDPKGESEAMKTNLGENLTTRTQICAENGQDYEDILRVRKREIELEKKYLGKEEINQDNNSSSQ